MYIGNSNEGLTKRMKVNKLENMIYEAIENAVESYQTEEGNIDNMEMQANLLIKDGDWDLMVSVYD